VDHHELGIFEASCEKVRNIFTIKGIQKDCLTKKKLQMTILVFYNNYLFIIIVCKFLEKG